MVNLIILGSRSATTGATPTNSSEDPKDGSEAGDGLALAVPSISERDALFAKLDVNGNGKLALVEVEAGVPAVWPGLPHDDVVRRAFKAADKSKRGVLGRREFALLFKHIACHHQLWLLFEKVDVDESHSLSLAEVTAACDELSFGLRAIPPASYLYYA